MKLLISQLIQLSLLRQTKWKFENGRCNVAWSVNYFLMISCSFCNTVSSLRSGTFAQQNIAFIWSNPPHRGTITTSTEIISLDYRCLLSGYHKKPQSNLDVLQLYCMCALILGLHHQLSGILKAHTTHNYIHTQSKTACFAFLLPKSQVPGNISAC